MAVMLVCDSTSQCKNVFPYKVLQSLSTKGFEGELICIYVYIHIYISWNQVTNHWPSLSKKSYLYIVRSSHNQHYAHGMAVMLVCASISQCTSDFHSKFDDHCQNEVACTWWHWHGNTNVKMKLLVHGGIDTETQTNLTAIPLTTHHDAMN